MLKKIIFALFLLGWSVVGIAQENECFFKNSVRIGYGFDNNSLFHSDVYRPKSIITLDADFLRLSDCISFGANAVVGVADDNSSGSFSPMIHYGLNLQCHLLQAAGIESSLWDLSLKGCIGSFISSDLPSETEYGVGFSATIYPFCHWGLFAECDWGRFCDGFFGQNSLGTYSTRTQIGISYRF